MDRYQKVLCEKAKSKRHLLGATFFPRTPVLIIDLSKAKKLSLYNDLLEGLDTIQLHTFVIMPTSKTKLPGGDHLHYISEKDAKTAYSAADMEVVCQGGVENAKQYACVPVAPLSGESTIEYNALKEKGNGFYFKQPTKWEIFAALVRALETYQFPYDWENLVREVLD